MSGVKLVCAECGKGFVSPTRSVGKPNGTTVYVIDVTPMWCPSCVTKRAKANPYTEAMAHIREYRKSVRKYGDPNQLKMEESIG